MTLLLYGSPTSTNFGNVVLGDHGAAIQSGQGYYYVVTAADAGNNESADSNEAFGLVPSS